MILPSRQNSIKIRAHHLFCIQGFQGYGYSSDFVVNMREIISILKSHPSLKLELVSECDVICACCPNRDACALQNSERADRIRDMDLHVLDKLGFGERAVLGAGELFGFVNTKLNKASDIEEVCGQCGWRTRCLWYLQKPR